MGNHFYVTPPDKKDSHPYRYDKEWLYLSYFSKSFSYIVELLRLKSLSLSPLSQTSFLKAPGCIKVRLLFPSGTLLR